MRMKHPLLAMTLAAVLGSGMSLTAMEAPTRKRGPVKQIKSMTDSDRRSLEAAEAKRERRRQKRAKAAQAATP